MPPRSAILGRSSQTLRHISGSPYVCPSCLLRQDAKRAISRLSSAYRAQSDSSTGSFIPSYATQKGRPRQQNIWVQRSSKLIRHSSTGSVASHTAINAPSTVPPELRELHQRLLLLQDQASSYVNLSQVQLALRSLESSDPVIRVAFLGLGSSGKEAARKLARVLFSDVLEDEEAWETALCGPDDGRSILLRYGDFTDHSGVQYNDPLVRTMSIPSPLLQKLNVEILISTLQTSGLSSEDSRRVQELEETILVPALTIANSNAGRVGFVRHPVHKALIISEGVSGAIEYGRLPASLIDGTIVNAALSIPLRSASGTVSSEAEATSNAIDIDLASHSVNLFREDKANGAIFSSEWQTSRVDGVIQWLQSASKSTDSVPSTMKPAVRDLLEVVFANAAKAITTAEEGHLIASTALTIPDSRRTSLQSAVTTWAADAHRDLQVNLDTALDSATWRKTVWWRLFWRIDEVSSSASDIVRRGWLVEAEQTLAFLSGRTLESGLATEEQLKGQTGTSDHQQGLLSEVMQNEVDEFKASHANPQKITTPAELLHLPPLLAQIREQSGLNALFDPPWPQTINIARQQMLHQLIPSMHRKAQNLLFGGLSTFGGASALAATIFGMTGGVALYEAGAVAALGLVWSLRRLQVKWSKERDLLVQIAREDGRRVIVDVEARLKKLVQDGGRVEITASDVKEWHIARSAVQASRDALKEISKG